MPKTNRIYLFLLLAIVIGCTRRPDQELKLNPSDETPGLRLSIEPTSRAIAAGEPVEILATLENPTQKTIKIIETTSERDLWLKVKDEHQAPVPLTRLGTHYENRRKWNYTGRQIISLNPGEKRRYKVIVNLFYDMTISGKYSISAAFFVGRDAANPFDEQVPITSDIVTVEIRPYMPKALAG